MSETRAVQLGLYRMRCRSCSHGFEAPLLSGLVYGERLIYTARGTGFVYADLIGDPVVAEVIGILRQIGIGDQDASILGRALVAASDAPEGEALDPSLTGPACPQCGLSATEADLYPIGEVILPVRVLTHGHWLSLGIQERGRLIRSAVDM